MAASAQRERDKVLSSPSIHQKVLTMAAKPNYQFEKRQREQQKKLKKAEKAERKANALPAEQVPDAPAAPSEPTAD